MQQLSVFRMAGGYATNPMGMPVLNEYGR
jgi:hypothetical protein